MKALSRGNEWQKARNQHVKQEPWCQCCGREKELEVHHFVPWHVNENLRTDPTNLVTLCRSCHFRFGHFCHWKDCNEELKDSLVYMKALFVNQTRIRRYK